MKQNPKETDLQDFLPLTETTFLILLSLVPEAKHGYAIMKDVQEMSHNRIHLSTGTLYGALKRLLEQDWIVQVEPVDEPTDGRGRKAYALTELGRRILSAETNRLDMLARASQQRLQRGML